MKHRTELTAAEYQARAARQMTERQLQDAIVGLARRMGFLVFHTYNSRRSEPGYPDLTLVHPERGRVLWIECKKQNGRLSKGRWGTTRWLPGQDEWLAALNTALPAHAFVARPSDWLDGAIERIFEQVLSVGPEQEAV